MKKRLILLSILLVIILVNFINATTCLPSQRIMKLYKTTNSHGALYNDATYQEDICFNEFFGHDYKEIENHNCDSQNSVINLYSLSNSHAEIPTLSSYSQKVCFGNIRCRSINTGKCNSDEVTLLSLYSSTNSHISKGDDPNYPIKICCKDSGTTLSKPYWTNMNNNPITSADLNDRVRLFTLGSGFKGNVEFKIYKKDQSNWLDFIFPDNIVTTINSDNANTSWIASSSGEYYFKSIVNGKESSSDVLTVTNIENNFNPIANILKPQNGIYDINLNLDFIQNSYDLDDFFDYTWNFGDTSTINGSSRNYQNYNTVHKYSSTGQKNILLNIIDQRYLKDSASQSVLIVDISKDGNYVFANILAPTQNQKVASNFEFDASDSYAISIKSNPPKIDCIAGNCPLYALTSSGQINIDRSILPLNNYEPLIFNWNFNDDASPIIKTANPKTTKLFGSYREYTVDLTVKLSTGESSSLQRKFVVYPTGFNTKCESNLNKFWDENGISHNTITEDDYCQMKDTNLATTCCDTDSKYNCRQNTEGKWHCIQELDAINFCDNIKQCSDYTNKTTCENDMCHRSNIGGSGNPTGSDGCSAIIPPENRNCYWTGSSETSGSCTFKSDIVVSFLDTINQHLSCSSTIINNGVCDSGSMTVNENSELDWSSVPLDSIANSLKLSKITCSGSSSCSSLAKDWLINNCNLANLCHSGTKNVVCEESSIALDFFNLTNLIFAILLLTILYLIKIKFNKKNKKIKKT